MPFIYLFILLIFNQYCLPSSFAPPYPGAQDSRTRWWLSPCSCCDAIIQFRLSSEISCVFHYVLWGMKWKWLLNQWPWSWHSTTLLHLWVDPLQSRSESLQKCTTLLTDGSKPQPESFWGKGSSPLHETVPHWSRNGIKKHILWF